MNKGRRWRRKGEVGREGGSEFEPIPMPSSTLVPNPPFTFPLLKDRNQAN